MCCAESQSSIVEELHIQSSGPRLILREVRSPRFIVGESRSVFKYKTPSRIPSDILRFLAEFSKRELSYPADAINAMQGILQMFWKHNPPLFHLEGVPVLALGVLADVFTEISFLRGLTWFHTNPAERRLEFPSWSWAGWTGQLGDFFMLRAIDTKAHTIATVCLEMENGDLKKFPKSTRQEDWQMFLSNFASKRIHTIRIQGRTLRGKVVHTTDRKGVFPEDFRPPPYELELIGPKAGYLLQFEIEDDILVYQVPKWDLDGSQFEGKELTCICLSDNSSNSESYIYLLSLEVLVVQEKPDGFAERVGCCNFVSRYAQEHGGWVYPLETRYWRMLVEKMEQRTIRLR